MSSEAEEEEDAARRAWDARYLQRQIESDEYVREWREAARDAKAERLRKCKERDRDLRDRDRERQIAEIADLPQGVDLDRALRMPRGPIIHRSGWVRLKRVDVIIPREVLRARAASEIAQLTAEIARLAEDRDYYRADVEHAERCWASTKAECERLREDEQLWRAAFEERTSAKVAFEEAAERLIAKLAETHAAADEVERSWEEQDRANAESAVAQLFDPLLAFLEAIEGP